jgi:hypothetical protein
MYSETTETSFVIKHTHEAGHGIAPTHKYMYAYMSIYIYIYIHTYIHTYIQIYVYIYVYIYICIHVQIDLPDVVCRKAEIIRVRDCVWMCVCVSVCVCVCVRISLSTYVCFV